MTWHPKSLSLAGVSLGLQHIDKKCLLNDPLMCMWRGTNCCLVIHQSNGEDVWQSPISFFSSDVRCGFHPSLWDFSSWIFLQELFGKHITIYVSHWVVFPGSSLPWMTRPFLVMKCAISIKFDNRIVHHCLGATQFSSCVPFCVSFAM